MTDKRFKSTLDEDTMSIMPYLVSDKEEEAFYNLQGCVDLLNEQQAKIHQQEEIIKSQDMEISRQYNLCLAMSGILREEFGVYDVFDRSKDKKVK